MNIREEKELREEAQLSPHASRSVRSAGRITPEEPCPVRTCYERDRDRILYSKSLRRLMRKTQAFLAPGGDHYRTRLTHTLEVSQIARSLCAALRLNETLAEAIALGHDLGHAPFGHIGEAALNDACPFPFEHNVHSLRVVDVLEEGHGLNLTREVRDGILNHRTGSSPATLEGIAVQLADKIAYVNHDLDDAMRAGVVTGPPEETQRALGGGFSERVNTIVGDIVAHSAGTGTLAWSPEIKKAVMDLRAFLFAEVYERPQAAMQARKAARVVTELYEFYSRTPSSMPPAYRSLALREGPQRAACDYVAGMTDNFAVSTYKGLFMPSRRA